VTETPRRALVTGGTHGIGLAVVRRLAREGHSVVAVYDSDDAVHEEAAREFAASRLEVRFERTDLRHPEQVETLFNRLEKEGRSPELLVNARVSWRDTPLALLDVTLEQVVDINLRATFLTCQQAVKAMARMRFGRIVNLTSPAGLPGQEPSTTDATADFGVRGYTRALAKEVAALGITANVVAPGIIRRELNDVLDETPSRTAPWRRAGTIEEVAGLVNMLCGEDAGYVTGQCLSIDGGLS
jgi:3-oxoacyl-[acyl-carrier protein] reductase